MELKKLGIIGISDGNGHPYSWSAIINGYEPAKMENCGFPVIPRYLAKKTFHAENFMEQMFTLFILNHLHQVKK